ncbi:transposase [Streptomyces sp. NPDC049970]|uniref:transposase n=1 Tax=Streptomyces sp. NPDC049970 TaxID=3155033 RepID=UPI00342FAD60
MLPSRLDRTVAAPLRVTRGRCAPKVVYVLTSGCAWLHLPPAFGTSSVTAHRRFTVWAEVGLWRRLRRAVLDKLRSGVSGTGRRQSSTWPPFAPKGGP